MLTKIFLLRTNAVQFSGEQGIITIKYKSNISVGTALVTLISFSRSSRPTDSRLFVCCNKILASLHIYSRHIIISFLAVLNRSVGSVLYLSWFEFQPFHLLAYAGKACEKNETLPSSPVICFHLRMARKLQNKTIIVHRESPLDAFNPNVFFDKIREAIVVVTMQKPSLPF